MGGCRGEAGAAGCDRGPGSPESRERRSGPWNSNSDKILSLFRILKLKCGRKDNEQSLGPEVTSNSYFLWKMLMLKILLTDLCILMNEILSGVISQVLLVSFIGVNVLIEIIVDSLNSH